MNQLLCKMDQTTHLTTDEKAKLTELIKSDIDAKDKIRQICDFFGEIIKVHLGTNTTKSDRYIFIRKIYDDLFENYHPYTFDQKLYNESIEKQKMKNKTEQQ